ncbi:MAG: tetratricopeptide repeat protein [Saprospiraceae bacterium]
MSALPFKFDLAPDYRVWASPPEELEAPLEGVQSQLFLWLHRASDNRVFGHFHIRYTNAPPDLFGDQMADQIAYLEGRAEGAVFELQTIDNIEELPGSLTMSPDPEQARFQVHQVYDLGDRKQETDGYLEELSDQNAREAVLAEGRLLLHSEQGRRCYMRASNLNWSNHKDEALEAALEAIAWFRRAGKTLRATKSAAFAADLLHRLGQFEAADRWYRQVLDAEAELGRPVIVNILSVSNYMSNQRTLGREAPMAIYEEGVRNQEAALHHQVKTIQSSLESVGDVPLPRRAGELKLAGMDAWAAGRHEDAIRHYEEALELYRNHNNPQRDFEIAWLYDRLTHVCLSCGALERGLDYAHQAMQSWQEQGNEQGACTTLANMATLHWRLGREEQARAYFEQTLVRQARYYPATVWQWHFNYGSFLAEINDPGAAENQFRKALEVLEAQRAGLREADNRLGFLGEQTQVYYKIQQFFLENGQTAAAFETLELAKSRTLVDFFIEAGLGFFPEQSGSTGFHRIAQLLS